MNAEAINSVIDNLAVKLAVPAAELMGAIPSFGVEDFTYFVLGGVLCILSAILFIVYAVARDNENLHFFSGLTASLCLFFGFLAVMLNLGSIVLWLYDPRAWSLRYLLHLFNRR